MAKRPLKRYKMRRPDKIRLSRQLDAQLSSRQEELAREEEALYAEYPATAASVEKTAAPTRRSRKAGATTVAPWSYPLRVALFFLLMAVLTVTALTAKRPTESETEKRKLAERPTFTVGSLLSGKYFDGINTWFADTFPGRETWVKMDAFGKRFYRMGGDKLYGTVEPADDIPDVPTHPTEVDVTTAAPTASTTGGNNTTTQNNTTAATTTAARTTRAAASHDYWGNDVPDNAPTQTLGGVLVRGDSAFEYYNFSQSTGDRYAAAINRAASQLKGKATVYDMVVPTSIGVMLPVSVRDKLNSSDQKKATDYLYGSMSTNVVTVPIIDVLRAHDDEYLYFHSDHHWTARGAYYAYAEFAKKAGLTPHAIGEYEEEVFDGFKGSFFSETQDASLKTDTVIAYRPLNGGDLYFIDRDGGRLDWHIITDVSSWAPSSKYNTFIGGDNPYTEITSGGAAGYADPNNESSIVVVKESFGNALVPFLVDHYKKVYVLDYRYYDTQTLASFVDANGVKTVLFINNMSATRNSGLVDDIERLVG